MKNINIEKLDKLPKWAQSEIKRLHNELFSLLVENELLTKQKIAGEDSDIFLIDGLKEIPLFKNKTIKFKMGERKLNSVSVRIDDNELYISTDSRIGERTLIAPVASNAIRIKFEKDEI